MTETKLDTQILDAAASAVEAAANRPAIDLSRIPRLAERQQIKAMDDAVRAAIAPLDAEIEALEEKVAALNEKRTDIIDEIEAKVPEALRHQILMTDHEGFAECCEASGLPLLDDDELMVDEVTEARSLRAALGLPPRASDEDDSADEADAA